MHFIIDNNVITDKSVQLYFVSILNFLTQYFHFYIACILIFICFFLF